MYMYLYTNRHFTHTNMFLHIFVYNVHVGVYDFVPMVSQDVYLGGKIRKFIFL